MVEPFKLELELGRKRGRGRGREEERGKEKRGLRVAMTVHRKCGSVEVYGWQEQS
jgi:hypothetical protein